MASPLRPSDPQFVVAYARAHEDRRKPASGTLFSLIAAFRSSSEFTSLGEKTQKDYRRYLRLIEDEFGTMPLAVVQDRRAREKFKAWRDKISDRPRVADYAWVVLARVLSVAKNRGLISVNVCERGGRLYEADRAEKIWLPEHVTKFCAVASRELQFALLLALWTGQRQGDLIRLAWSQYDGTHIRLRQGKDRGKKGRKRVVIPVGTTLKAALDMARPAKAEGTILRNSFGEAWPATASAPHGERRSTGQSLATPTYTFTIYEALPSHVSLSLGVRSRRLQRSPATHRGTCKKSWTLTTLAAR